MKTTLNSIYHTSFKILFIVVLCVPLLAHAQTTELKSKSKTRVKSKLKSKDKSKMYGSLDYLSESNGYQGITLGSDIKFLPALKLDYLDQDRRPDADGCIKYEYKITDSLKQADTTLNIDLIALRTYNNQIVNIYIFFEKKEGFNFLNTFLNEYGPFNKKPDDYKDIYGWNSSDVDLSLKYDLDVDLGLAVFTSNSLQNQLKGKSADHVNAAAQKTAAADSSNH